MLQAPWFCSFGRLACWPCIYQGGYKASLCPLHLRFYPASRGNKGSSCPLLLQDL